jgi:hypothetical protein
MTRRGAVRAGAGVLAAGALGAPMVHAQGSGGNLRFAFWDHWVPGSNDALRQLGTRWAERTGSTSPSTSSTPPATSCS